MDGATAFFRSKKGHAGFSLSLLLHWVNTLPPRSCLLVSQPVDIYDGRVLRDILVQCFLPPQHEGKDLGEALHLFHACYHAQDPALFEFLYQQEEGAVTSSAKLGALVERIRGGDNVELARLLSVLRVLWDRKKLAETGKSRNEHPMMPVERGRRGRKGKAKGSGWDRDWEEEKEQAGGGKNGEEGEREEEIEKEMEDDGMTSSQSPFPSKCQAYLSQASFHRPGSLFSEEEAKIDVLSRAGSPRHSTSLTPPLKAEDRSFATEDVVPCHKAASPASHGGPAAPVPPFPHHKGREEVVSPTRALSFRERVLVHAWLQGLGLPVNLPPVPAPPVLDRWLPEDVKEGVDEGGGEDQGPSSPSHLPLHRDSFRNGRFLCALFLRLEPEIAACTKGLQELLCEEDTSLSSLPPSLPPSPPSSLVRARERLRCAFWLFRCRTFPLIPLCYFERVEDVLLGDTTVLWSLLWELRNIYNLSSPLPPSLPPSSPPCAPAGRSHSMKLPFEHAGNGTRAHGREPCEISREKDGATPYPPGGQRPAPRAWAPGQGTEAEGVRSEKTANARKFWSGRCGVPAGGGQKAMGVRGASPTRGQALTGGDSTEGGGESLGAQDGMPSKGAEGERPRWEEERARRQRTESGQGEGGGKGGGEEGNDAGESRGFPEDLYPHPYGPSPSCSPVPTLSSLRPHAFSPDRVREAISFHGASAGEASSGERDGRLPRSIQTPRHDQGQPLWARPRRWHQEHLHEEGAKTRHTILREGRARSDDHGRSAGRDRTPMGKTISMRVSPSLSQEDASVSPSAPSAAASALSSSYSLSRGASVSGHALRPDRLPCPFLSESERRAAPSPALSPSFASPTLGYPPSSQDFDHSFPPEAFTRPLTDFSAPLLHAQPIVSPRLSEDEASLPCPARLGSAEAEDILGWLGAHGIVLQQPERLLLSSSQQSDCPEFSDGLLLARLLGRLEGWGEEGVEGIDWSPGTAVVTRLQNLKRVLDVWRRKRKGIPLHLLHREFDILEGRTDVLLPLLWHVRRVYDEGDGERPTETGL